MASWPLLAEITKQLGSPQALKGFTMVSVQHLFPSTRGLYDALKQNGLPTTTTSVGVATEPTSESGERFQ